MVHISLQRGYLVAEHVVVMLVVLDLLSQLLGVIRVVVALHLGRLHALDGFIADLQLSGVVIYHFSHRASQLLVFIFKRGKVSS